MKKLLKYILRGFAVLLLILLVLYVIVYAYVSVNKKSLIADITEKLSKRLDGDVKIGDVELSFFSHFPRVSIVLNNVSIDDTAYSVHNHRFFAAKRIVADLGYAKLIRKQASLSKLTVEEGALYLFTDSSGYSNKYLLQLKKAEGAPKDSIRGDNELNAVDLKNVTITIMDRKKDKLYDFKVYDLHAKIRNRDASLLLSVKHTILVHSLAFNTVKGSFIKEQIVEGNYRLDFNREFARLAFDSIQMKIGKHPFYFTGHFIFKNDRGSRPEFALRVNTKDINFDFAKSLLTAKIIRGLSVATLTSNLDVALKVAGPLGQGGEPAVNVSFIAKNTSIKSALASFENCNFIGNFSNEALPGIPRGDTTQKITVTSFSGSWRGLPISSRKAEITNLRAARIACDLHSAFPLSALNSILNSNVISLDAGEASAELSYNGPVMVSTGKSAYVNGNISIIGGTVNYIPRDIPLNNVNGNIRFRNTDVFVEKLSCKVLNNSFTMDASARNVLSLVNTEPNKILLDWNISSASLNLAPFTQLLKKRRTLSARKRGNTALQDWSDKLDAAIEKGIIHVSLKADKLVFRKFDATNALASITILQDSWILHNISLQHAGGSLKFSGSMKDQGSNFHLARLKADLYKVDVSKTFAAFDNFGQDGITGKSLQGKLSSNIDISVGLDDDGRVRPAGLEGIVNFSLKEGALVNYEPVKRIQEFIFKKRDFSNIRFAELKDKLVIKNQEVTINRMEIQSNVLTMFLEGKFSMKNSTDISIQVPLSNLKKRGDDYIPVNEGASRKAGMSIYLRGTPGPDGNVKFKYDPFKKFRADEK